MGLPARLGECLGGVAACEHSTAGTMNIKTCALAVVMIQATCHLDAAVLTVTSLADIGPGSLRDQIALSAPGDTIQFAVNGKILLNSAITINHQLMVQGPGAAALTVDA